MILAQVIPFVEPVTDIPVSYADERCCNGFASPSTKQTLRWMKLGQVSASIWVLVGLTGLISAGALLAWEVWTDNLGVGERMMASPALSIGCIASC